MKDPDITILSQIQKAHSIGSIVTMISFIASVFIRRISELEFLIIPLIIIFSLTTLGSIYYLFQSIKYKVLIERPLNNNIAFIIRIVINVGMLFLIVI